MSSIRREFVKTLFQKRTYIGWGGLFLVPWLITIAFRFSSGGPRGGGGAQDQGAQIFDQVRSNGLFVALAALLALATFLLPLLASMSGSYTVAGEAEGGTLRTTLMQPIRRSAFLISKSRDVCLSAERINGSARTRLLAADSISAAPA